MVYMTEECARFAKGNDSDPDNAEYIDEKAIWM